MAGLGPAIHVFVFLEKRKQDVDHRDKPGDDTKFVAACADSMRASDRLHVECSPAGEETAT
jgi:hypothetical protein